MLDTDAGVENGWLSKLISAEGIKDVADISYSDLATINPDDYEGVAKKLATLMKSMAKEAEDKIIDEKAYLVTLMQAQQSLDSRLEDRVGINFNEAIYDPAQMHDVNTLAKSLDEKGNKAAGKLVTLIKSLNPQSKLVELLTEINLASLNDDEKLIVSDVKQLMALSHLDQAKILSKLPDEHREKLAGFIQKTEEEILSLKINYVDMLHASLERARGKGIEASAHLTALGLSSQVKAGTSSKDLSGLSGELNHLESQISTTSGVISELERSGASKEEFDFYRNETLKSFQSRTQKLSAALIEQLEPSNEQLSNIEAELEKEAQTYFLAIEDGEQSNIIKMLAELFQSLLDKIGILRKDS